MTKIYHQEELDEALKKGLQSLHDEPRSLQSTIAGREKFLSMVEDAHQCVPPVTNRRHIEWKANLMALLKIKKARNPMLTTIITIITVLTMALGGGGITLAAAQSAMPDQALYPVKTWTENVSYELASTDENRLELALQFTERRMEEIRKMLQAGTSLDQAIAVRYQAQIETALLLAVGMGGDEALRALQQIQLQLRSQEQVLNQLQLGNTGLRDTLNQTRLMLQLHLQWAKQGADDPAMLKQHIQNQQGSLQQVGGGSPWVQTNQPENLGSVTCLSCTPDQDGGNNQNPWTSETPIPGSGYGPGSGTCDFGTCTPAQDGSNNQNPWTTGTPIPGSGYGPGLGTCMVTVTTIATQVVTETFISPTATYTENPTLPPSTQPGGGGSGLGTGTPTEGAGNGGGGGSRP